MSELLRAIARFLRKLARQADRVAERQEKKRIHRERSELVLVELSDGSYCLGRGS